MTYSRAIVHHPVGFLGLGQAETDQRHFDFERWWLVMNRGDPRLQPLNAAMQRMRMPRLRWELHGSIEGDNYEIREGRDSMENLRALWIRQGKRPEWWPGAQGEYNFGPNTRSSKALRISEAFYRYLTNETRAPLFAPHKDGYVRLSFRDPLLRTVRGRLIAQGYLAPQKNVSTKDDSAFVRAMRTVYEKERDRRGGQLKGRNNKDWWPSGINFGPNTNTNELRVHPEFLDFLLNRPMPDSETVKQGVTIKAPVMGPLPSVRPGERPTWEKQRQTVSPGVVQMMTPLTLSTRSGIMSKVLGK